VLNGLADLLFDGLGAPCVMLSWWVGYVRPQPSCCATRSQRAAWPPAKEPWRLPEAQSSLRANFRPRDKFEACPIRRHIRQSRLL